METLLHSTEPPSEPITARPDAAPQLRTLLLTDLVDSTGVVERLGDKPASELFRAHDRLVLQLQQQWRGRLIDRSDGMLLLFERPIDGLGFALDYVRALADLGRERNIDLRARAGLHVGEVLTWRNSDEAVSVGAKPVEVEGLAKPMAARLMAMARPGQILLSAVAEPLTHRAARELGERGQHLLWKSWGRWRFKGVPQPQHVFEVGEPGFAPLRVPPDSPKAWRDIPLWRRPAALAAEVALLVGGALGLWFIVKPQPAIAFDQRDWVVVGDLRNLTGQATLDDSLEQAFRISLEQSRHVNVLSDLKARDTLARMQRPGDTVLDRAIASEIALRDGARAVILPTVAEVGGRVRVSAEVIDPRTQTTVYAESADGKGVESVLGSIDTVTAALRGKLGEAVQSIEKDSVPLPQVTTSNLDALRAYALAQRAYGRSDYQDALQLYERATELDPQFALGWLGQMRVHFARTKTTAAVAALRKAQSVREHLAPREAMYLDAWATEFDDPAQTAAQWQQLAKLYPDYWAASGNAADWLYRENRFAEALPFARASANSKNQLASLGYDALGRAQLGLGQYELAKKSFNKAVALGFPGSRRRLVAAEAAAGNFASANKFAARLDADRIAALERISLAIDQGQPERARSISSDALEWAKTQEDFNSRLFYLPAAVADWAAGEEKQALGKARQAIDLALTALRDADSPDRADDAFLALAAALLVQRMGDAESSEKVLSAIGGRPDLLKLPSIAEMERIVRAERLRGGGSHEEAIALLQPLLTGHERYQARVALRNAYLDAGQMDRASEQTAWLLRNRGRAYVELGCGSCMQALNVADSNVGKAPPIKDKKT